ncbi:MAG: ABC transporter substrate-binding protein, partial [Chloroflexota bacterium]
VNPKSATLEPGLASSWGYSDDGQQVTFQLPGNLTWSDGSAMTAETIAEGLQATEHPALRAFSNIEATDDETLKLTFTTIDCGAVTTLGQLPLIPASHITKTIPAGSGPFIVDDWSEDQKSLTLTQNPNYHRDRPYLDRLSIRFLQATESTFALSEGQFDLIGPLSSPLSDQLNGLETLPNGFTDVAYPKAQMLYLAINFAPKNEPPLSEEVRQALTLALDREAILDEALQGEGELLGSSLLAGHWAAESEVSPPPYDPEQAKALLRQAGLRDNDNDGWLDQEGERLELSIRLNGGNQLHQNLGWLISGYYRELGVFARAEGIPSFTVIEDLFGHDYSLELFSWRIQADPDQYLYWHSEENERGSGLNFTSYNNSQMDQILERGRAIEGCAVESRAQAYQAGQLILAEDRPVDFLMAPYQHLLVADHLYGVDPGPFAPFSWNAATWYIRK